LSDTALRCCPASHRPTGGPGPCGVCRVETITTVVTVACPELAAGDVAAAIEATITNPAAARSLATALADGPAILAAGAPPVVGRLVGELRARGSVLAVPACARCDRTGLGLIRDGTVGLCPRCRTRQLSEACSACHKTRVVTARRADGGSLCFACAPRPARTCGRCGRVGPIARRAKDGEGDICNRCYRLPMAECGTCGQSRRCTFVADGHPICSDCSPRRSLTCAHCGQSRPPSAHWPEGPVCEPCYRAGLSRRGTCSDCGTQRRLIDPPGPGARRCADCSGRPGLARRCVTCGTEDLTFADGCCARCVLAVRARRCCSDRSGRLHPELVNVAAAIADTRQPYSALNWLERSAPAALLAEIAAGDVAVTHEALDAAGRGAPGEFVRHLLVTAGVLAARDDALVALEAWVADRLEPIGDPARRRLLRSYATWRVLRRARTRAARTPRARTPIHYAKVCLLAAIALLAWLDERGVDLADVGQGDIEAWSAEAGPAAPEASDFLDWATTRKLIRPVDLAGRQHQQGVPLDADRRWAIVDRLLHDDSLRLSDRVAGCLVLLYGQQLARIVALTVNQVTADHDGVYLHLGTSQVVCPEPLGGLLRQLATGEPRPYNGVGSPAHTPWLFPGLHAGRPLHPSTLGERLRHLGIPTMRARRAALMDLASQLPAAVLAEVLHLHPTTAVHWAAAAGGDWNTYAAHIARQR
jgi:hypothetical protein